MLLSCKIVVRSCGRRGLSTKVDRRQSIFNRLPRPRRARAAGPSTRRAGRRREELAPRALSGSQQARDLRLRSYELLPRRTGLTEGMSGRTPAVAPDRCAGLGSLADRRLPRVLELVKGPASNDKRLLKRRRFLAKTRNCGLLFRKGRERSDAVPSGVGGRDGVLTWNAPTTGVTH